MEDILTAYRPTTFKEVYGQKSIIQAMEKMRKENAFPSTFLLHGDTGLGKTTIARIITSSVGCTGSGLLEIDAATFSGVENIRKIAQRQQYVQSTAQVTIIDECQALSAQSWKALLKPIEEAPKDFYWILCTTEPSKVPKNIKTRCHQYGFVPVVTKEIRELVEEVMEEEEIELDDKSLSTIINAANGSPRQALAFLSTCRACHNDKEVKELLQAEFTNKQAIELIRLLAFDRNPSFEKAISLVRDLKEGTTAETIRLTILNYCANVILSEKGAKDPEKLLAIMEEFESPYFEAEKLAPVLIAIGRLML